MNFITTDSINKEFHRKLSPSIQKGQIVWCKLNGEGSEQNGLRPCIIVQNNIGNRYSPTTIVVPLTSRKMKKLLPTHLLIEASVLNNDMNDSIALTEQIRIIDKSKIVSTTKNILSDDLIKEIDQKMIISLGILS